MHFQGFSTRTENFISKRREEVLKRPRDRFLDLGLNVGDVFVQTQPVPKVRRRGDGEGVLFRRRLETIPVEDSPPERREYD
jgi:hypothetical protein